MKHLHIAISFALGAVLAAIVTHGIDHHSHARHVKAVITKARVEFDEFRLLGYQLEILEQLRVLAYARGNRFEPLITLAEQKLGHVLWAISSEYPTEAPPRPEAEDFKIWKGLADYCAAYPFKTGEPDVDEAVQEAVTRVRERTKF